jgi:hypothetical protein
MNDERTKQRVTGDEDTNEQLSTSDLAEAGHDSPRTELTEPRVRAQDPNVESRRATPVSESRAESPSSPRAETALAGDTRPEESAVSGRPVNSPRPDAARISNQSAAPAPAMAQETGPLFAGSEANELRSRWDAIQVGFVDEPRRAVEQADNLVAGTMKRLAEMFAEERNKLEHQWDQGENVSTEDLRQALRRYRSFFGRLLSV